MDWALAIRINRGDVLRLLAAVFSALGLEGDAVRMTVPRHEYCFLLRILRPAESAVRRLIVVAARGLVIKPPSPRPAPEAMIPRGTGERRKPIFPLFDPRRRVGPFEKRVAGQGPSVRVLDGTDAPLPKRHEPSPDDPVDAGRLVNGRRPCAWRWMICPLKRGDWRGLSHGARRKGDSPSSSRCDRAGRQGIARRGPAGDIGIR